MAKVITTGGMTVELSAREVTLIREALAYAVRNKTAWSDTDDATAQSIDRVMAGSDR